MQKREFSNPTNHLGYIDLCKAVGILLVILGHTYGIPTPLYNIIYSFHMPLFFIISGFLYNENKYNQFSLVKYIVKKFKDYIVPYFTFAFINLFLQILWNVFILKENITINFVLHNIKGILLCYSDKANMPNCSPIWFLMCLFVSSILFFIIIKYTKKFLPVISIASMLLSYCLYLFCNYKIPWKISTSLMAVFFIYIGYLIRKHSIIDRLLKSRLTYLYYICFCFLGIVAALSNGNTVGMNENTYGNLILLLISSISLSTISLTMCKRISVLNLSFFLWLGKNTMFTIGFNYFMRDLTTELYYCIPVIRNFHIHWSVSFVITTLACIICTYIYSKFKSKFKKSAI